MRYLGFVRWVTGYYFLSRFDERDSKLSLKLGQFTRKWLTSSTLSLQKDKVHHSICKLGNRTRTDRNVLETHLSYSHTGVVTAKTKLIIYLFFKNFSFHDCFQFVYVRNRFTEPQFKIIKYVVLV